MILAQVLTSDGGTGGAGDDLTLETGDPLQFEENASVPGGVPAAGLMVLWQKDDQTLQATTDAGDVLLGQALTTVDNTLPRFDGTTGLLQNSSIVVDDGDSITVPGNLTLSDASSLLSMGDGSGAPRLVADKDGASEIQFPRYESDSVLRWAVHIFSSEDYGLRGYDSGGSLLHSTIVRNASGNWEFPADISAVDAAFSGTADALNLTAGGAVVANGVTGGDDGVLGDGSDAAGLTIFTSTTTAGGVTVTDVSGTVIGQWRYDNNASAGHIWVFQGSDAMRLNGSALFPQNDGGLDLGIAPNNRWGDVHADALTIAGDGAFTGEVQLSGDLNHDGLGVGFYGTAPAAQSAAYTRTATVVESRVLNANAVAAIANNNAVLAALIADLQAIGILA